MPPDLAGIADDRPALGQENALAQPSSLPEVNPALLIRPLAEVERTVIENAIHICRGNIPMAAVYLGLSPSTLYRKRAAWQNDPDAIK